MRGAHLVRALSLILLVVFVACERSSEDATQLREWSLSEDLRIGGAAVPEQALTRIGGVLATPDGGVWVLQPSERDIRVYGSDGALVRKVGRGGQAPGEFTLPNRMGWWGASMDTVWVADLGLRRLSLFSAAGDFVTSYDMPFVQHEGVYSINQPGAVLSDGSALAVAAYSPIVTEWDDFPLLRYALMQGTVAQELARLERTGSVMVRWQERSLTTSVHPIPDSPIVAFSPDGSRVLIVERSTEEPQLGRVGILALGAGGDTLWSRSYPYEPEALPQAEIDSLFAPRIASVRQFASLEGSLSVQEAEQAYRESVTAPSYRPPVHTVHVGLDGRIWLGWASAPGTPARWSVLSRDGQQVASFTTPRPVDLRAAGSDFLWAVDVIGDVSSLVRYRFGESEH